MAMDEKFQTVALRLMKDMEIETTKKDQKREIQSLRDQNQTLKKKIEELNESLEANVQDRERVIALKTKKLHDCSQELDQLKIDYNTEKEQAAVKYMKLYKTSESVRRELQQKVTDFSSELQLLNNFHETKLNFERIIENLRGQLCELEHEHTEERREIEQKYIQECDRIRNENIRELIRCKAEMQGMIEEKIDTTTRRTISENEKMSAELRYQSDQIEKLIATNTTLLAQNKALGTKIEIETKLQQETSRKVFFYEKLFKKLQLQDQLKSEAIDLRPASRVSVPPTATAAELELPEQHEHFDTRKSIAMMHDASRDLTGYLVKREQLANVRSSIKPTIPTSPRRLRVQKATLIKGSSVNRRVNQKQTFDEFLQQSIDRI